MVAYEAAPFFKRGGLGDVMESLPKALKNLNIDARVIIPYYKEIQPIFSQKKIVTLSIEFDSSREKVEVYKGENPQGGIKAYFLQNKHYLEGPNVRGKNKRIDEFAFFNLAVGDFILWLKRNRHWTPQLVHCNDWQTALIPLVLSKKLDLNIPTLLTIHNLNYQGVGSLKVLDILQIKDESTKEIKRGTPATEINVLGEGIIHATRVATVSPSYAKEVIIDYDKNPIAPFIKKREEDNLKKDGRIIGILNGVDYDIWSPKIDEKIYKVYDNSSWEVGKAVNKYELLKELGLADRPTFCFIGRMAWQKGIDILIKAVRRMGKIDFNLIFLGLGTPAIEKSVTKIAKIYPSNIKALIAYSEEMAHKIYAGSDFIIIPSRYEPCGLIQMVAMRYGTIPIASKTGGLADSIQDEENGILFKKNSTSALVKAILEALRIYENKNHLKFMVTRAMKTDFSWDKSAVLYKKLYKNIIESAT